MNPQLMMLNIAEILVDTTYQRGLDEKRVRSIAKAFDPGAVKPLSVSRRKGGAYYVYDGQHTMEVLALKGYTHVPAYVVEGTREDEARWFVLMNGKGTRKASKAEAYLAGLTANDPAAIGAREVLKRYGLTLSSGGVSAGKTTSIAFIQTALKQDPERLEQTMRLLHKLWPKEPETWTRMMLRGVWEVVGAGLTEPFEAGAIAHKVTPRRILDVAQGMQYATGEPGSGAGHVKRAMLQLARVAH